MFQTFPHGFCHQNFLVFRVKKSEKIQREDWYLFRRWDFSTFWENQVFVKFIIVMTPKVDRKKCQVPFFFLPSCLGENPDLEEVQHKGRNFFLSFFLPSFFLLLLFWREGRGLSASCWKEKKEEKDVGKLEEMFAGILGKTKKLRELVNVGLYG